MELERCILAYGRVLVANSSDIEMNLGHVWRCLYCAVEQGKIWLTCYCTLPLSQTRLTGWIKAECFGLDLATGLASSEYVKIKDCW